MASLKEEAQKYVPKKTKNIADLDIVPVDCEIKVGNGTDSDGLPFKYKYIPKELDDGEEEQYRVPNSVIEQIQTMMNENPKLTHVKVIKKGTGLDSRYTVVQKDPNATPKETATVQA